MHAFQKYSQSWRLLAPLAAFFAMFAAGGAMATDYGAVSSGTWNTSIWTPAGVPGSSDRAFIGTNNPAGSAGTASVALSADQSVSQLYVGYGNAASSGTLNLAGHKLTISSQFDLGLNGGSGTILDNGGSFDTPFLYVYSGNSLVLGVSDAVSSSTSLSGSSLLTTSASGNVAGSASLDLSSTLTLGAPMTLSGNLDLERSSTLNMAGYRLSAATVYLGWSYAQPVSVLNAGPITASNLDISSSTLALNGTGNVIGSLTLYHTSTLTLGGPLTLSGNLDVEQSSTLNMAGQALTAPTVYLGWNSNQPVTVLNGGPITATNLDVYASAVALSGSGAVTNLTLSSSAQATTAVTGNVTGSVTLDLSSTLTLGAPMTLSGYLEVDRNSTLNMAGQALTAPNVYLGYPYAQPAYVLNAGPITASYLYDYSSAVALSGSGAVANLTLSYSAQATTGGTGNVTGAVSLDLSSSLTLGAPMTLSGALDVERSSTLNMANNPLSATTVELGWGYSQPVTVLNRGPITATNLDVAANTFNFSSSDAVTNLTLSTSAAATTSATGNVRGSVSLDLSSTLTLGAPMTLTGNLEVDRSSTLNMAGQALTAPSVYLGYPYALPASVLNAGPITATNLYDYSSAVALSGSGAVANLTLSYSAQATTGGTGNVTGAVSLDLSSSLTLGAPMTLSGALDVERSSTLNMAGQPLKAYEVLLGWYDSQPVTVLNRGPITTTNLYVAANTFNFSSSDAVTNLTLSTSAQATTSTTGNVTGAVSLDLSSSLTLGAPMTLSGALDVERSSTLNMAGQPLSAATVELGYPYAQPVTVLNAGPITATNLYDYANAVTLSGSSAVTNLTLSYSGQVTTSTTGSVTGSVSLDLGSSLTLGAPMTLSGNLDVERSSTLNMAGQPLKANGVLLGWYDSQPVTVLNAGPITANYLYLSRNSLALTGSGVVTNLTLSDSAQATTSTTGSVTGSAGLDLSSSLTLGAPMTLSGNLDLERSSTLNMAGYPLSANAVQLGWNYNQPYTLLNRGPITAAYLEVGIGTFNLSTSDAVTNFYLDYATSTLSSSVSSLTLSYSSQATTSAAGNVAANASLDLSSTLTLGAPLTLSGNLDVERSSTLNMAGQPLKANEVLLGWYNSQPVTVLNAGPITANYLYLSRNSLALTGSSVVTNLALNTSAQATTSTTGNVTGSVSLDLSSSLTLGAPMTLSGNLDLERSSTLNMAGYPLSANVVQLGWNYNQPYTVLNRGPITAAYLEVGNGTFNLSTSDAVTNYYLDYATSTLSSSVSSLTLSYSSQATTSAAGNVKGSVSLDLSSTLTLGAPMTLSGNLEVERSSTLNMAGQPLKAYEVLLGWYYSQPVTVLNAGPMAANYLYVAGGSHVTLSAPNSVVDNQIEISGNSVLTLAQTSGQVTGLTFYGTSAGNLILNDTSVLKLSSSNYSGPSWLFRWQDVGAGNWVNTVTGSIAAGQMAVSTTAGYSVFDEEGYTYVATPSTLIWNGAGGDINWSTSGNWSGATPTAGQWLRFGALSVSPSGHVANNNNLAANSLFYGIFFDKLAPSYVLEGNAIELSGDVLNQSGSNQTIGLNIQLVPGNGAFNTNAIIFDSGAKTITDSGSISGAGMELVKTGTGTLILSGSNTYSGGTVVLNGTLKIASSDSIFDGTSLIVGAGFAAPFVAAPTTLLAPSLNSVPEPSALGLLAAGAVSLWLYRRRR